MAPGVCENGPGREPALPGLVTGSGGALSLPPPPGTSHPWEEVTRTGTRTALWMAFTRARTQKGHWLGHVLRATSQHARTPALTVGGRPGLEPVPSPRLLGLRTERRGRRQVRGGRAVAWRRGRTGAWPRRGLLQWHQVSPGAASAQAHLQGHLGVAARGECRSDQLATPPRPPQCKADSPTHPQQHGYGTHIAHTPGQAGGLPHTHPLGRDLHVGQVCRLSCQGLCQGDACRSGGRPGAPPLCSGALGGAGFQESPPWTTPQRNSLSA